jgi:DNA-binding transcriptional regulator YiaG
MPNIGLVLRQEISRLARKEIKGAIAPFRKDNAGLKRTVADLKRRIVVLERDNKRLQKIASAQAAVDAEVKPEAVERARISAQTIRTLRNKLGLTQVELAKLLDVSGQTIYQWESKDGPLTLRSVPKAAIIAARGLGARDARARLEEIDARAAKATAQKGKGRRSKGRRKK